MELSLKPSSVILSNKLRGPRTQLWFLGVALWQPLAETQNLQGPKVCRCSSASLAVAPCAAVGAWNCWEHDWNLHFKHHFTSVKTCQNIHGKPNVSISSLSLLHGGTALGRTPPSPSTRIAARNTNPVTSWRGCAASTCFPGKDVPHLTTWKATNDVNKPPCFEYDNDDPIDSLLQSVSWKAPTTLPKEIKGTRTPLEQTSKWRDATHQPNATSRIAQPMSQCVVWRCDTYANHRLIR